MCPSQQLSAKPPPSKCDLIYIKPINDGKKKESEKGKHKTEDTLLGVFHEGRVRYEVIELFTLKAVLFPSMTSSYFVCRGEFHFIAISLMKSFALVYIVCSVDVSCVVCPFVSLDRFPAFGLCPTMDHRKSLTISRPLV